ncbi:MAG: hypothetical protein JOZ38_07910 [Candidatus Eremiobacteraeota bacterium]|nr:hypothetical protein [Candidatus Eremiobacteraeota bacterium]
MHTIDIDDQRYIEANFRRLPALCAAWGIPARTVKEQIAAEVMPDATYRFGESGEFFPDDYFVFPLCIAPEDRHGTFLRRLHAACTGLDLAFSGEDAEETWRDYLRGAYGVCLRVVLPETIVRKVRLIAAIEREIATPDPGDAAWRKRLTSAVDGLDALLKPFARLDRETHGGSVSRDRYVTNVRLRFGIEAAGASGANVR